MATGTIKKGGMLLNPLWTNTSPSSSFAAQTIQLDLSSYDMIAIEFKRNTDTGNNRGEIRFYAVGSTDNAFELFWSGNYAIPFSQRFVDISTSGVQFYNCYQKTASSTSNPSSHNQDIIPLRIYSVS